MRGLKFKKDGPAVVVVQSALVVLLLLLEGQDVVMVSVPLGRLTEAAS
jgi:hypothetical protein